MIKDLIVNTINNLKKNKISKFKDIGKRNVILVDFSEKIKNSESEIKSFLRTKMYNNKNVLVRNDKGKIIIKKLYKKIINNPKKFLSKEALSPNKYRAVSDFISGMTDRYAINLYNNIK